MWKSPRYLSGTLASVMLAGALISSWTDAGATTHSVTDSGEPKRSVVTDNHGSWVATFTQGSRSVTIAGPERTFSEPTAASPVVTSTYVRLLPEPYSGTVDTKWLEAARVDPSPDLLAIAAQYIDGSPAIHDEAGIRIAGDASYGPLMADGKRAEGADFNDYFGMTWDYPEGPDSPEPKEINALDCSGFVRMVFGYRGGYPMTRSPAENRLPRRSYQMHESGPGTIIQQDKGTQLKAYKNIQAGDLVFFDAEEDPAGQMDHVGVYLGQDTAGKHRFISSRKSFDGPTMGDTNGRSILDGTGHYAKSFRAVRRL